MELNIRFAMGWIQGRVQSVENIAFRGVSISG